MALDPVTIGMTVVKTGMDVVLGNNAAAKQKKAADKAAQKTQKYNKKTWRYEWDETQRRTEHAKNELEILSVILKLIFNFKMMLGCRSGSTEWVFGITDLPRKNVLMMNQ
jgi:hypothetical protein